jgi:hypothetical protein
MPNCKYCDTEREEDEFPLNYKKCIHCVRKEGREYRKSNDKAKVWATENKERMQELQSRWYQQNKAEINRKRSERLRTDEDFKTITSARGEPRRVFKGKKSVLYLSCTREEYVRWVMYCLKDGMAPHNYGRVWVIDHVLPLNDYKETKNSILFKWYNTMPVFKNFNLKKNKFIDSYQLQEHLSNFQSYCDMHDLKIQKNEKLMEYEKCLQNIWLRETPKTLTYHPLPEKDEIGEHD